jgi:hypothetical protein
LLAASPNNEADFIIKPYHKSTDIIIKFIMKAMTNALLPSASACVLIPSIPSAQRFKGHCGYSGDTTQASSSGLYIILKQDKNIYVCKK